MLVKNTTSTHKFIEKLKNIKGSEDTARKMVKNLVKIHAN